MSLGGGSSPQPQFTPAQQFFPTLAGPVTTAIGDMFNKYGLNLPPASTGVAPEGDLMSQISKMLFGDISGAPGSPGQVGRSTLTEMAQTGDPTNTEAAIATREKRRQRAGVEGSAQVAEQFGSRGQRLGSGVALGTSDFLSRLDESFAQQEADIEVKSAEAAAGRKESAARAIPGFETTFSSAAFPVASFEQALAQMPFDLDRQETIRRQGGLNYFPNMANQTVGGQFSQQQFGGSPIPGILGGAGSLATGAANIMPFIGGSGGAGKGIADAAMALAV